MVGQLFACGVFVFIDVSLVCLVCDVMIPVSYNSLASFLIKVFPRHALSCMFVCALERQKVLEPIDHLTVMLHMKFSTVGSSSDILKRRSEVLNFM